MSSLFKSSGAVAAANLAVLGMLLILISGCQHAAHTSSAQLIQKRKYTPGYHVNVRKTVVPTSRGIPLQAAHSSTERYAMAVDSLSPHRPTQPALAASAVQEAVPDHVLPLRQASGGQQLPLSAKAKAAPVGNLPVARTEAIDMQVIPAADRGHIDYRPVRRTTPPIVFVAFISGVLSLWVLPIVFGPVALVCGIIGLDKVNKDRQRYEGKGFAIAAVVIGVLTVMGVVFAFAIGSIAV